MANLSDYIFMKEKYTGVRVCWSLLYLIFTILTIGLVGTLWKEFLTNPIITTLDNRDYPVAEIPFPGIAICNINKISKKRAAVFAQRISDTQQTQITNSEVLEIVNLLGKLHDFEYSSDDDEIIQKAGTIFDNLHIDLRQVLNELASNCEDLLAMCRWKGVQVDCSEIFQKRLTYSGYCCTFNYIKKTKLYNGTVNDKPLKGVNGLGKGLTVLVNNDIDDYVYTPLSTEGITVLVFEPSDYPDKASGSLIEVIANLNIERYVEIRPTTVVSVRDVIEYPLSKRQCLFDEERATKFDGDYSQSDCNVDCRVASSLALCGCIPFMIPLTTKDNMCTLNDLKCLNKYRSDYQLNHIRSGNPHYTPHLLYKLDKWNVLYPEDDISGMLKHEEHDSLRCTTRCYPSCSGTSYEVATNWAPMHKKSNQTAVHVYYGESFSHLYKQDVVYYWFEILSSNFGGTFGLVIGMSMVSMVECLIFALQLVRKKFTFNGQ